MNNTQDECSAAEPRNLAYVEPSALQRLQEKRKSLADRLEETERAIRALENYPELQAMVDLVRKATR